MCPEANETIIFIYVGPRISPGRPRAKHNKENTYHKIRRKHNSMLPINYLTNLVNLFILLKLFDFIYIYFVVHLSRAFRILPGALILTYMSTGKALLLEL